MRVAWTSPRGNGAPLLAALRAAGHQIVEADGPKADILVIDHDADVGIYSRAFAHHDRALVYAHGGGPCLAWDWQWPPNPKTVAHLVCGPGQAEVIRRTGFPRPAVIIGWQFFSPLKPFQPCVEPVPRVLFAPQHAMASDYIDPRLRAANAKLHPLLCTLHGAGRIDLTVRSLSALEPIGIARQPGVHYRGGQGHVEDALAAIAQADVVVGSAWTFPCLAIASGVPTLVFGQIPSDDDHSEEIRRPARTFERYREFVHFPLDPDEVDDVEALWAMLVEAMTTDVRIAGWRDLFIGPPFDAEGFVRVVEQVASTGAL